MTSSEITGLHHVGLIVHDLNAALDTFRAFGFHLGPPAYPALPPAPGAAPEPIGAGNTHADFPRSFIELLAFAPDDPDRLPEGARLVPLQIPETHLDATRNALRQTVSGLAARLDRFEGVHILVFTTTDAEATAVRLNRNGVRHTGARAAQRPIATAEGTQMEPIKFLEISDHDPTAPPGLLPEGRVGAAEDAPGAVLDAQIGLAHPNGAKALAECVLCVPADGLDEAAERYERYLGIAPRNGTRTFDLGRSRLTLATANDLAAWLPGEIPPAEPAVSAYVIETGDLDAAEQLLRNNKIEFGRTADGEPFIPAAAAHGAAIVFSRSVA